MNTYEAYKNKEIDLSAFGLERCGNEYTYFCTPMGADVFASPGVDGIHYCTVEGFGEIVFAVSPMNCPGEYVHPVARSFDDFLRLLFMLDGDAAIEQCWQWSEEQFEDFMAAERVSSETKEAACALMEQTGLEPMEQPYQYIHNLQKIFNYKSIPFSEEYYEMVPPEDSAEPEEILCEQPAALWAVYYRANFWADDQEGECCEEIPLEKHFSWAGRDWYIPSVYTCEEGMVADILFRVDAAEMQAFMEKWGVTPENEGQFNERQLMQMEQENPLDFSFRSELCVNGQHLRSSHSCSTVYAPFWGDGTGEEWKMILEYYNLDRASCWAIGRFCYPWADCRHYGYGSDFGTSACVCTR